MLAEHWGYLLGLALFLGLYGWAVFAIIKRCPIPPPMGDIERIVLAASMRAEGEYDGGQDARDSYALAVAEMHKAIKSGASDGASTPKDHAEGISGPAADPKV